MTPYEEARAIWQKEHCNRTFEEDCHWHMLNGWLHCTPSLFVMGRDVPRNAEPGLIVNPSWLFPKEQCDCWHIYLLAGSIEDAFRYMPWHLPWVSFERKNELRFYRMADIQRLTGGITK